MTKAVIDINEKCLFLVTDEVCCDSVFLSLRQGRYKYCVLLLRLPLYVKCEDGEMRQRVLITLMV